MKTVITKKTIEAVKKAEAFQDSVILINDIAGIVSSVELNVKCYVQIVVEGVDLQPENEMTEEMIEFANYALKSGQAVQFLPNQNPKPLKSIRFPVSEATCLKVLGTLNREKKESLKQEISKLKFK